MTMAQPENKPLDFLNKGHVITAGSIIGSVLYALLTTGYFATKGDVQNAIETTRTERVMTTVSKDDYRADMNELKGTLNQVYAKVEEIRIDQARRH